MKARVSLSAVMALAEMERKKSDTVTLAFKCLTWWAILYIQLITSYICAVRILFYKDHQVTSHSKLMQAWRFKVQIATMTSL